MARIYVASSWRNPHQPGVVETLRDHGHEVYDFRHPFSGVPGFAWSEIDPEWQAWSAARYRELLTTHPIAARGFLNDLRGMQWADTCVLILPCGRSAHLEAGWFCGQGKRTIIFTRDGEEPELMALLATEICISIDEVLKALSAGLAFRHSSSSAIISAPRFSELIREGADPEKAIERVRVAVT